MARFTVDAKEAVRLLTRRWRLPTRLSKKAAEKASAAAAAGKPIPPKMTAAYRYLHRGAYHFYQAIGTKAVSVFATHVNENGGTGTLRRTRGTSTKLEVYFKASVAARLLKDNLFLKDNNCVAGIVRALAVVFRGYDALHLFTEPGPTAGGPRTLVCRNAYIAMIATKVRAHLVSRAASKDSDDDAADDDTNGEEQSAAFQAVVHLPDAESAGVLNSGHRTEWEEELATIVDVFATWGTGAVNGLRIGDANDATRADATRAPVPSQQSPSEGSVAGSVAAKEAAAAAAAKAAAATAAAATAATAVAAASARSPAGGYTSGAGDRLGPAVPGGADEAGPAGAAGSNGGAGPAGAARAVGAAGAAGAAGAGGSGSPPNASDPSPSNGSNINTQHEGRANIAGAGSLPPSNAAANVDAGDSTDDYTSTNDGSEEGPYRRLRTPAEAAAAAANRAARRVIMDEVD